MSDSIMMIGVVVSLVYGFYTLVCAGVVLITDRLMSYWLKTEPASLARIFRIAIIISGVSLFMQFIQS